MISPKITAGHLLTYGAWRAALDAAILAYTLGEIRRLSESHMHFALAASASDRRAIRREFSAIRDGLTSSEWVHVIHQCRTVTEGYRARLLARPAPYSKLGAWQ